MEMPDRPEPLQAYLNRRFVCNCGREHYAPLRAVSIRKSALEDLPLYARIMGFQSLFLVSDPITYEIAGRAAMGVLRDAGINAKIQVLSHIAFDEGTVGELLIHMPKNCDLVVAVGTGAINDMTRFFSYRVQRPFFTIATAAPMDGFASSISALNVNHLKTTFETQTPTAIIGDTEILKNAPYPMIAAGLGDLLGKFTCLCDWKMARLINGEHYCDRIVRLVESNVQSVMNHSDRARDREPEVLGSIMEGLVLTGVAMSLYGNSRPASGCEHHMSHYWEMMFEQSGRRPIPHGTQVGVATVLILKLAEALQTARVDFAAARRAASAYDPQKWAEDIRRAYGPATEGIIAMEAEAQKNAPAARLARIDTMESKWDEILALLEELPSSAIVTERLRSLQSACLPNEIGVDSAMLKNTFLYCKEVRSRYTFLQMLWDLDLLAPLSESVIEGLESPN